MDSNVLSLTDKRNVNHHISKKTQIQRLVLYEKAAMGVDNKLQEISMLGGTLTSAVTQCDSQGIVFLTGFQ